MSILEQLTSSSHLFVFTSTMIKDLYAFHGCWIRIPHGFEAATFLEPLCG